MVRFGKITVLATDVEGCKPYSGQPWLSSVTTKTFRLDKFQEINPNWGTEIQKHIKRSKEVRRGKFFLGSAVNLDEGMKAIRIMCHDPYFSDKVDQFFDVSIQTVI